MLQPDQTSLKLTFKEKESSRRSTKGMDKLTLFDLSSTLNDFNLLYTFISLATLPDYEAYRFSSIYWWGMNRRLKEEHKLYLGSVGYNSPLTLDVIIPTIAAAVGIPWLFLQALEKIQSWPYNRQKLRLEVEKLELEVREKQISFDKVLQEKNALETYNRILARLERSPLQAVDIEMVKGLNDKKG